MDVISYLIAVTLIGSLVYFYILCDNDLVSAILLLGYFLGCFLFLIFLLTVVVTILKLLYHGFIYVWSM